MKADRVIWGVVCASAIVVGAVFAVVVPSAPAHAQYVGDGVYGAGGSKFSGGTLTSGITFSGVATDIATAGSEDLTLAPGGAVVVNSGSGLTFPSASTAGIFVRDGASTYLNVGAVGTGYLTVVSAEPRVRTSFASLLISNGYLDLAPNDLTVSTTTAPTASFNRISADGAVAWTPAAPSTATAASFVNACSVDASHTITMTDGSTYEGSGCALAVNDCVTMIWDTTSTKWRELSCNNN